MMKETTTTTYKKKKYDYDWKQVNVNPQTKQKLAELAVMMGTEVAAVSQAKLLDYLITQQYNKMKTN